MKAGDGYLCKRGLSCRFELSVIDYEFAAETGRSLAKLLAKGKPYQPWWDKNHNRWHVKCGSVLLYQFLREPWEKLRPYVEHCRDCVADFLRAFFDGEGSITERALTVNNTDKKLPLYIQQLLQRYFGIETTGPRRSRKKGQRFCCPYNGKIYKPKKTWDRSRVRVDSLPRFHHYIGFTIRRKQLRLIKAIQK